MKNSLKSFDSYALDTNELSSVQGGIFGMLALVLASNVLFGLAVYGEFMEGYNDGVAAAQE